MIFSLSAGQTALCRDVFQPGIGWPKCDQGTKQTVLGITIVGSKGLEARPRALLALIGSSTMSGNTNGTGNNAQTHPLFYADNNGVDHDQVVKGTVAIAKIVEPIVPASKGTLTYLNDFFSAGSRPTG